jgi:hypothetical protein
MDLWVQIPYALNIAILVPVCLAMFTGQGPVAVFLGMVQPSRGRGHLVGGLWPAILGHSLAGLF